MLAWRFVIAGCILAAVIQLCVIARTNLGAIDIVEGVPRIALAAVGVGTCVAAHSGATWLVGTVVDVIARLAIAIEPVGARIALSLIHI